MTADQRHPFEYIFTDVNFMNQSSTSNNRSQSLYVSNPQNDFQNVQTLANYTATTNPTQNSALFPQENYVPTANASTTISLEVDSDDIDFAPAADGELIAGKINLNPTPPRLFSNLFPLGGGRHVSHPVELHKKFFCTKTSVSVV